MVVNAYHNYRNESNACIIVDISTTNGFWPGRNPLIEPLPLLIMQLAWIIFVTRSIYFILRPLHQPRLVTDILGGFLLGPSFFGRNSYFSELFSVRTVMTLETVAYMALDFYIFLIGMGMDINSVKGSTRKELSIAAAGALIPMAGGAGLFFLTAHLLQLPTDPSGCLFWGMALTVTGFHVVAQILEELNLFNTDIGRLALSTARMNDICSWILVAIVLPIRLNPKNASNAITLTTAFILVCIYAVRPALVWIIDRTSKCNDNDYSHHYLCFILIGVVICSLVTEMTGTCSIVGAFVFGIIIPDGELSSLLTERFADFVSGVMLPIFLAICGIRINIHTVHDWFLAAFIIIMICSCKILSTLLFSLFYCLPFKDSFAVGMLMNTKGILAVVLLNLGWDKKVLHDQEYAVIVIAMVIMTFGVAPIISAIYGTSTRRIKNKGRSVQHTKQDAELRILACLHSVDNVSGTIYLLSLSNPTKESPLCVFALHLVELTDSTSAMLIVHDTSNSKNSSHNLIENSPSDQIITAFEAFEKQNTGLSVHPLTGLSPFTTMHEDVCNFAKDKRIAFMILPFHNEALVDSDTTSSFREVNSNILVNAPCSVGIFVDKGLCRSDIQEMQRVVMVFIGGPDDREALAFAWRMSAHPLVQLTVLRFHSGNNSVKQKDCERMKCTDERQIQLDTEFVNQFRLQTAGEQNVNYYEKVVSSGEETIDVLREMEVQKVDLYIVGREVTDSLATAGLSDWSEWTDIGAIGDLLVLSGFACGSVLIVQHCLGDDGNVDAGTKCGSSEHGFVN